MYTVTNTFTGRTSTHRTECGAARAMLDESTGTAIMTCTDSHGRRYIAADGEFVDVTDEE